MRVLIFSPEQREAKPLERVIGHSGLHTDVCTSLERLLYLSMTERYAALVLQADSQEDYFSNMYFSWKKQGGTGLFIILTANQSGLQRGRMLEKGVDHYFIKPFSYTRLISTIVLNEYKNKVIQSDCYVTNTFSVDILRRTIHCNSQPIDVTKTEFDILSFLIRHKGIVLTRLQIWEEIWGYEQFPQNNTVDVHMARIRKKLPKNDFLFIITVPGIGYQLHPDA